MEVQYTIDHLYQDENWNGGLLDPNETTIHEKILFNNVEVGHFLIIKKKLRGLPFYTMRITFGPSIDYNNIEIVDFTLKKIKQIAKAHKAISVQVHPFTWGPKTVDIRSSFEKNGFDRTSYYIYEATMLIDLKLDEEAIFKRFESRGREAVRQSQRRGITAKQVEVNYSNFKIFYKLYSDTCGRTEMIPESAEKIHKILFHFSKLGKAFLFFSFFEDKPVSSFVAFKCGNCLSLIYQGSDYNEDIQKRRPANGLYWETIRWAKQHGYRWFDLAGVNANPAPGSKSEGIRLYKRQFGAEYVELPGNFEFVNRPFLAGLMKKILPLYSQIALSRARKKLKGLDGPQKNL